MIKFDQEVWDKNVSLYHLVDNDTKKTIEEKHLLHNDSALLNRFYKSQGKSQEWRMVGRERDSRKSGKKYSKARKNNER